MTNRQLGILVAAIGGIALISVSFPLWYSQLSPFEKCLTQSCREAAFAAELEAIEARYAPKHEANHRDLEVATSAVEAQKRHIEEVNQAIRSAECRKNGVTC